ncbi:pancreatic secretory trypsin inhibitor-like [Neopelma chrysocephalum]|uniref:pancreatic secretory trypsin inhibitor-like n=1 Tax=Neopelma chrysocephalum TaxID=114329 RepID=UPI000FCD12C2|nr:pancreatic secretory trypsin inhibitor-like [Neopelma chrysocephalum]
MKATGIFLLLSLALCCYQGIAEANGAAGRGREPACGNFNLNRGCTRIFEPICGTDDVLYSNECLLCLQNMQRGTNVRIKNRGMCQKPSPRSAN